MLGLRSLWRNHFLSPRALTLVSPCLGVTYRALSLVLADPSWPLIGWQAHTPASTWHLGRDDRWTRGFWLCLAYYDQCLFYHVLSSHRTALKNILWTALHNKFSKYFRTILSIFCEFIRNNEKRFHNGKMGGKFPANLLRCCVSQTFWKGWQSIFDPV